MRFSDNKPSSAPRLALRDVPLQSDSFNRSLPAGSLPVSVNKHARYVPAPLPRKPVSSFISMPAEPEDAHITGATRSLSRRLLALNIRQAS